MIATLITTILVALGVATGNVSNNAYKGGNAFNHELIENEKPQPKKAVENYTFFDVDTYTQVGINGNYATEGSYKYYMGNNNDSHYLGANYSTPYMNVYNTIYTYNSTNHYGGKDYDEAYIIIILKINNYYDTTLDNIHVNFAYWARTTSDELLYENTWRRMYNNNSIDQYIDNTISSSRTTLDIATAIKMDTNYEENWQTSNQVYTGNTGLTNSYAAYININYDIGNIAARESKTIVIMDQVTTSRANSSFGVDVVDVNTQTTGLNITMSGYINTPPPANIEVVDIPNLMFTIITLPFAWYSTAFNLTIFPGTPYQLNFGNLIMTIVAALILLYLIKKIIK